MSDQTWVLLNIKQYCFDKDSKFFEEMLLGFGQTILKIEGGSYYQYYLLKKMYEYAKVIKKDRWLEAEKLIKKEPEIAYLYAKFVIKGRWPEAEKLIKKEPEIAYIYAKFVIKGRWPEAEKNIRKCSSSARKYAKYVLKKRWKVIEKNLTSICDFSDYVQHVLKSPNSKLESLFLEKLSNCSNWEKTEFVQKAVNYCVRIKKKRWIEAEQYFANSAYIENYCRFLKKDEKAKEEFRNKILICALMNDDSIDSYGDAHYVSFNYAKQYLENSKETAAV